MLTAIHLALKEVWRNRGRFLLFSLVVALITLLILFVAALGEGLGSGNREYLEKKVFERLALSALPALPFR
jgi:putative ABC transport system permease protein